MNCSGAVASACQGHLSPHGLIHIVRAIYESIVLRSNSAMSFAAESGMEVGERNQRRCNGRNAQGARHRRQGWLASADHANRATPCAARRLAPAGQVRHSCARDLPVSESFWSHTGSINRGGVLFPHRQLPYTHPSSWGWALNAPDHADVLCLLEAQ
jgi:hypothetical protein